MSLKKKLSKNLDFINDLNDFLSVVPERVITVLRFFKLPPVMLLTLALKLYCIEHIYY